MKMLTLILACAASVHAQAPPANPLTAEATFHYRIIRGYVTRAAQKMPAEDYAFRPTPEVRTFAQLIGHLADSNYRLCSVMAGQNPPMDPGIEMDRHSKTDLLEALADSFDYCDKQYAAMTDAAGRSLVKSMLAVLAPVCRFRCLC
jgi:DinB superfamily